MNPNPDGTQQKYQYTYDATAEETKTNIYGNNMLATTGADTLYYQYNNHGSFTKGIDWKKVAGGAVEGAITC